MNCSRMHSQAYDCFTPIVILATVLYYWGECGQEAVTVSQVEGKTYGK